MGSLCRWSHYWGEVMTSDQFALMLTGFVNLKVPF